MIGVVELFPALYVNLGFYWYSCSAAVATVANHFSRTSTSATANIIVRPFSAEACYYTSPMTLWTNLLPLCIVLQQRRAQRQPQLKEAALVAHIAGSGHKVIRTCVLRYHQAPKPSSTADTMLVTAWKLLGDPMSSAKAELA